jgi:hypothetical protein
MIQPATDDTGRLLWVSIVPPLSPDETEALTAALVRWRDHPVVYTHNPPEVKIIQLCGRWEPEIEDEP